MKREFMRELGELMKRHYIASIKTDTTGNLVIVDDDCNEYHIEEDFLDYEYFENQEF